MDERRDPRDRGRAVNPDPLRPADTDTFPVPRPDGVPGPALVLALVVGVVVLIVGGLWVVGR